MPRWERSVLTSKYQRIVGPQHHVRLRVRKRHLHRPGEQVSRGELLFVEANGLDPDRENLPGENRVRPLRLRHDAVLAAADELGAHLLGEDLLDLRKAAAVLERRDTDDLDVVRKKRSAARERVATATARQRERKRQRVAARLLHHDRNKPPFHDDHLPDRLSLCVCLHRQIGQRKRFEL